MLKLAIMQGRLLPPEPGRFQAFPRRRWRQELDLAAQVGLDAVEWIVEAYGAEDNPMMRDGGGVEVLAAAAESGVGVRSICADYFMDHPFLRCTDSARADRQGCLAALIRRAGEIGANRIVLPFVDASRIETAAEQAVVVEILCAALPLARAERVELHLEASLQPAAFASLLARVPDEWVRVNYDSGNSAALGHDVTEEFASFGERIGSIHIKDRVLGGGTVPLGSGNANFPALFQAMRSIGYCRDLVLQVARGEPGDEVAWAQRNCAFVRRHWSQYGSAAQ